MTKKTTLPLFFLAIFCSGRAQTPSCCSMTSTSRFAMLGEEPDFLASHASPLPFVYESPRGKMISLPVVKGNPAKAFEIRAEKPTKNYLIVIHEWWGLNDYMKQEAEKLQQELG